jgi:hypothetical protein
MLSLSGARHGRAAIDYTVNAASPPRSRRSRRLQEVDLRDEDAQYVHRQAISALIQEWVAAPTLDDVGTRPDVYGVLWKRYRTLKQWS